MSDPTFAIGGGARQCGEPVPGDRTPIRWRDVWTALWVAIWVAVWALGAMGCAGLGGDAFGTPAGVPQGGAAHPADRAAAGIDASLRQLARLSPPPAGILSESEQDVVTHLNLVRLNPSGYGQAFIAPRRHLFRGTTYLDPLDPRQVGLRTREGPAAVDEAARALGQFGGMGALRVSPALTRAAREHAQDQATTGRTGHEGAAGSVPSSRIQQYGQWERIVGEVIAYGPVSGREVVSRLLIDDGVPSRGHRRNILNPAFQLVGVAIAAHPRYGRVVVVDLAADVLE